MRRVISLQSEQERVIENFVASGRFGLLHRAHFRLFDISLPAFAAHIASLLVRCCGLARPGVLGQDLYGLIKGVVDAVLGVMEARVDRGVEHLVADDAGLVVATLREPIR